DLAERAPLYVARAASDYSNALGCKPSTAGDNGDEQARERMEAIHRELFSLREAKIALDKAVVRFPPDLNPWPEVNLAGVYARGLPTIADSSRRESAKKRSMFYPQSAAVPTAGRGRQGAAHERIARRQNTAVRAGVGVPATTNTGHLTGRSEGGAALVAGGSSGARTRRRTPLAEVQEVDPDLPLPLPAFPGYVNHFAGGGSECGNAGKEGGGETDRRRDLVTAAAGGGDARRSCSGNVHGDRSSREDHGYFLPGAVAPRQRQGHGLPHELRAIFTTPKPEQWKGNAAAAAPATKRRGQTRPKPSKTFASRPAPPTPPPMNADSPLKRRDWDEQGHTPADGSGDGERVRSSRIRRRGVSGAWVGPGSAAAAAAARAHRRNTSKAVEDLRKEMREREDRLMVELDRLRKERAERAASGAASGVGYGSTTDGRRSIAQPATASVNVYLGKNRVGGGGGGGGGGGAGGRARAEPSLRVPFAGVAPSYKTCESATVAVSAVTSSHEPGRPGHDPKVAERNRAAVETADSQPQTAADIVEGVHIYLPPAPPTHSDVIRGGEHNFTLLQTPPASGRMQNQGADEVTVAATAGGSSVAESWRKREGDRGGYAVRQGDTYPGVVAGQREMIPPPPVVLVEGEGRNVAWRPADDDRLLATSRHSVPGAGGGGSSSAAGRGVQSEVPTIATRPDISTRPRMPTGPDRVETTLTQSASLLKAKDGHEDRWVDVAGMLGLSTEAAAGAISSDEPFAVAASGEGVGGAQGGEEHEQGQGMEARASVAVMPQVLELMREVVGQQSELGEERSALMQALRAEMESRRALLANQEISLIRQEGSLREREA
ncbi:unnamed protein product, partial [Sphacelaria rigidula]